MSSLIQRALFAYIQFLISCFVFECVMQFVAGRRKRKRRPDIEYLIQFPALPAPSGGSDESDRV